MSFPPHVPLTDAQQKEMLRSNQRQVGMLRTEVNGLKSEMTRIAESMTLVLGALQREPSFQTGPGANPSKPSGGSPSRHVDSTGMDSQARGLDETFVKKEPHQTRFVSEGFREGSTDPLGDRTSYELGRIRNNYAGIPGEDGLVRAPTPMVLPPGYRSAKLARPTFFSGEEEKLDEFLAEVNTYIYSSPDQFPHGTAMVSFAVSHLRGKALRWLIPDLSEVPRPEWLSDYAEFVLRLRTIFGSPDEQDAALWKMGGLKQTTTALEYLTELYILNRKGKLNDAGLINQACMGLSQDIMNNMTAFSKPKVFSEFQVLAVSIDNRIREQAKRAALLAPDSKKIRAVDSRAPAGQNASTLSKVSRDSDGNPKASAPPSKSAENQNGGDRDGKGSKFKVGGKSITDEQRRYRRANNLCLYCESEGHRVVDCPQVPKKGKNDGDSPQVRKARGVGPSVSEEYSEEYSEGREDRGRGKAFAGST